MSKEQKHYQLHMACPVFASYWPVFPVNGYTIKKKSFIETLDYGLESNVLIFLHKQRFLLSLKRKELLARYLC